MTRRRFFPAQPVQRTPGNTVQVEFQIRPTAPPPAPTPAPAPGCSCEATGVAWLVQPQYTRDQWGAWWGDPWPDMRAYEITAVDEYGGPVIDWDTPMGPDFPAVRMPLAESDERALTLVAIATGPQTRGVEWSVERSGSTFPIDVDAQSHVVITLHPFETDGGTTRHEVITLTARCGDTVVGTLRLQVYVEGW